MRGTEGTAKFARDAVHDGCWAGKRRGVFHFGPQQISSAAELVSCFSPKPDENPKIQSFWVLAATSSLRNQHSFSLEAGEVIPDTLEYTFRAPFQLFRAAEVWHSLRSTCGSSHWELFLDIALTDPLRGSSSMEHNANHTSSGHIRV